MRRLTPQRHPDLVVGADTGDDAAVWRLDDTRALVVTADFITPIVDDARTWGRIAAVNAVSDVYAMGGRPLLALNLVCWDSDALGSDLLVELLEGAADAAADGGWAVVGGHTIEDPHPSFGLSVVGEADPNRLLLNSRFRPGDALVLTKALGVGVVSTAVKAGTAPPEAAAAAVDSMLRSNAEAATVALAMGATGATDITGFGLLGHLRRALEASGAGAVIEAGRVPLLPEVAALAAAGLVPGGTRRNLEWASEVVRADGVDDTTLTLLADAQTSGGLLMGLAPDAADGAVERLRASGHAAAVVGSVVDGAGIVVKPS